MKEERAKLEEKVALQLEGEKVALLEKKRRELDEARRRQDDLERILADNRRKVGAGDEWKCEWKCGACWINNFLGLIIQDLIVCMLQVEEAQLRATAEREKREKSWAGVNMI